MQSALIVYSRHTKKYAEFISKSYKNVKFLEVSKPPAEHILAIKSDKDVIIGIGGGSVIDTAKIISKNKRCIAIPTTASGAAITPYATIWGTEKKSIAAKKPILKMDYKIAIRLSSDVMQSTVFDALSHAIESFWSKYANSQSKKYSKKSAYLIKKYLNRTDIARKNNIKDLVIAGNIAGKAISITKTNVIHAVSYPITLEYGIMHGNACGMVLPGIVEYMDFKPLPELFDFDSTKELVIFFKKNFTLPKIKNFDIQKIADKSMKYDKINNGPKKIGRKEILMILKNT